MDAQSQPTMQPGIVDTLVARVWALVKQYRVCILVTLLAGLAAHLFFLSHKITSYDDPLTSYGVDIASGRWGLRVLRWLVPPFSMPWFNGLVTLVLTAISTSLTVQILNIRRPLGQALVSAVVVTSALYVSLFCHMATSTPYALAIVLTTLAAHQFLAGGRRAWLVAALCLLGSLSIYQMYAALFVALLIVYASLHLLERGRLDTAATLRQGASLAALLLVTGGVYLLITWSLGGINSALTYGVGQSDAIPMTHRIIGAYVNFVKLFILGFAGMVNTPLSMVAHLALAAIMVITIVWLQWRRGGIVPVLCQCLLLAVAMPLVVNCAQVAFKPSHLNTLTIYSFVAFYYLAVALTERFDLSARWHTYDITRVLLTLVVLSNIYYANRSYLKMQIAYNNAVAYYTGIATQVKQQPQLWQGSKVALVGKATEFMFDTDKAFGTNNIRGTESLINHPYKRAPFVNQHLGFDVEVLNPMQCDSLASDPRVKAMPVYPYNGSIQTIDDIIVVKLGEQ